MQEDLNYIKSLHFNFGPHAVVLHTLNVVDSLSNVVFFAKLQISCSLRLGGGKK